MQTQLGLPQIKIQKVGGQSPLRPQRAALLSSSPPQTGSTQRGVSCPHQAAISAAAEWPVGTSRSSASQLTRLVRRERPVHKPRPTGPRRPTLTALPQSPTSSPRLCSNAKKRRRFPLHGFHREQGTHCMDVRLNGDETEKGRLPQPRPFFSSFLLGIWRDGIDSGSTTSPECDPVLSFLRRPWSRFGVAALTRLIKSSNQRLVDVDSTSEIRRSSRHRVPSNDRRSRCLRPPQCSA